MYDAPKIIFGILIFLFLFTTPLWFNIAGGESNLKPDLKYPTDEKECLASKEFMNHYHMDMLNDWRDNVVRSDSRFLMKDGKNVMVKGEKAEMSLSRTCMKCHTSKANFCDQCHNYLDVKPYCWDCHVAPEEVKP